MKVQIFRLQYLFTGKINHLPKKRISQKCLPRTRHIDESTVVVESLPGIRVVSCFQKKNIVHVPLYFPYVYFVIEYLKSHPEPDVQKFVFHRISVGFSQNQILKTIELIGNLPLSNYYDPYTKSFCLGDGKPLSYDSLAELTEAAINAFWHTTFQFDVNENEMLGILPGIQSENSSLLKEWIKISKEKAAKIFWKRKLSYLMPIRDLIKSPNVQFFEYEQK